MHLILKELLNRGILILQLVFYDTVEVWLEKWLCFVDVSLASENVSIFRLVIKMLIVMKHIKTFTKMGTFTKIGGNILNCL